MAVVDDLASGMDSSTPSEDFGRQPPQDLAAEQAVLGGMLLSKDAIADVLERLRPGDFYRPAHQNVYDAILDLYGRGEPADAVTVAAELDRRGTAAPHRRCALSAHPDLDGAHGRQRGLLRDHRGREGAAAPAGGGRDAGGAVRLRGRRGRRRGRGRRPRAGRDLRRRRPPDVGGLRPAGGSAAADDGRDRRHRLQRRHLARRADRLHRTRRGDQRSARRADDHRGGQTWSRANRRWDWIFCGPARSSTGWPASSSRWR